MASNDLKAAADSAAELMTTMDDDGKLPFATLMAATADPEEMPQVTAVITHVFDSQKLLPQLIVNTLSQEIVKIGNVDTVLRGSSLATSVLSYAFQVFGFDYLASSVNPIAKELLATNSSCEVNPAYLDAGACVDTNRSNLRELSLTMLDAMIANRKEFPNKLRSMFRSVCLVLDGNDLRRDSVRLTGGMLFFLRFVNPFLTNSYDDEEQVQRAFTLVAKLFQATANGRSLKEAHMKPLNEFTPLLKEKMDQLVDYLMETDEADAKSEVSSAEFLEDGGYAYLHRFLLANRTKLLDYCVEHRMLNQRALKRFEKLLSELAQVV